MENALTIGIVTGAGEGGVRNFCERLGRTPDKLTVAEAIEITKGQYSWDVFSKFFAA